MGKKWRRTSDDVINSYVENYRCMVNRGASLKEVVEYGLKKGELPLPKAKTTKDILIQRFTKAQRKQMSFDDVVEQPYNTNICYLFGDEYRWIKQDKAALENAMYSRHRKRSMAVGLLTSNERNRLHWNRTRPDSEQMPEQDCDLGQEVLWNLKADRKEATGTDN